MGSRGIRFASRAFITPESLSKCSGRVSVCIVTFAEPVKCMSAMVKGMELEREKKITLISESSLIVQRIGWKKGGIRCLCSTTTSAAAAAAATGTVRANALVAIHCFFFFYSPTGKRIIFTLIIIIINVE